jgi:MATE family multidrug resistance protein
MFQVFDGSQAVGLGILRGLTEAKFPTMTTFIAYWVIGIPIAHLLGFWLRLGVIGIWIGLLIGLAASAVLLVSRFYLRIRQMINQQERV